MDKTIRLEMSQIKYFQRIPEYTVTVDNADYAFLSQFRWSVKFEHYNPHAVRYVVIGNKKLTIRMERLITEARHDQRVIHIDGNRLNNRRRNLQIRTLKAWTGRPNHAGYRGVHQLSTNHWSSTIEFAGHKHLIGTFGDPVDAAKQYDDAAKKLYGINAVTNF